MSNRYVTSKAESKALLKAGLNPETADMVYIHGKYDQFNPTTTVSPLDNFADQAAVLGNDHNLPAWSLAALLAVMPTYITMHGKEYRLAMRKYFDPEDVLNRYEFQYEDLQGNAPFGACFYHRQSIQAACDMVYWLITHNHINR